MTGRHPRLLRGLAVAMSVMLMLIAACSTQLRPAPLTEADIRQGGEALVEFIGALDAGDHPTAVRLLRSTDGSALSRPEEERLINSWIANLGASGERVDLRVTIEVANPIRVPSTIDADAILALTATLDGRSQGCPPLPIRNVGAQVALIAGNWYVLQDSLDSYDFACAR